jgi:hypothetical protein
MITRKDYKDFLFDPPLTELGSHQCKTLEGLQMHDKISIRIEPCLFEFFKGYPVVPVKWPFLDLDELTQNGYNIDKSYKPFYPIESLRKDEDELMFYTRSYFITKSILKNHEINQGNLLIVGHVRIEKGIFYNKKQNLLFIGINN